MSKKITFKEIKALTYDLGQPEDSIEIKGNLDYPTILTDPMVLKRGSCTHEQLQSMLGQLKELVKSYDVKIELQKSR